MKLTKRLYQIILEPPLYSLQKALDVHSIRLSKVIVDKVVYAIDNDIEEIDVAEVVTPFDIIILKSSRIFFQETLEHNMENLIAAEEYEYCALCRKYIEKIKDEK